MTGPRAVYPPVRPRRLPTWLRAVGWLALLLSALFVVTWRQTRGLELDAALRDLATQHELAEAERLEHQRNIQRLRSRARVLRVARERLGMRLAVGDEIVFLPAAGAVAPAAASETAEEAE